VPCGGGGKLAKTLGSQRYHLFDFIHQRGTERSNPLRSTSESVANSFGTCELRERAAGSPGVVTKGLGAGGLSVVAAANPWALRVGGAWTC
jgi:hypothetical protein